MSETPKIEMSADFVFDPDYLEEDPAKARFYEAIRQEVNRIMEEYGAATEEDIASLPHDSWAELRQRLLDIKITLNPSGEIIHG